MNPIIEFIDQIPINDLVHRFIKLKKISGLYWGLCPFHNENTPSLVVNNDKKFFYCFGCGTGGNVINFLMKIKEINFVLAVQELNSIYGLKFIVNEKLGEHHLHNKNYEKKILDFFENYTKICNQKLMINNEAMKYLNQRGVSLDIIRQFNLGYDDGNINDLIELGYSLSEVQEYGVLTNEDWASKFKNRIILPITNINGSVISISGRIIHNHKNTVKYLHSIENSIFYKKTSFFNYHNIYKSYEVIYVVEGFFDMLTCINNNIPNVVACLGSSISNEQVFVLQKHHKHIKIFLDGDEAGLQGMIKAAYKFIPYYHKIKIEFLLLSSLDPGDYLMYNNIESIPHWSLENFLWEYHLKPPTKIIDGGVISNIQENIQQFFKYFKNQDEISQHTFQVLNNYWKKKVLDLTKIFYKNNNQTQQPLPIPANKCQIFLINLFFKVDEILLNIDFLSKIFIKENKLFHLFNKILNIVLTNDHEDKINLQSLIKESLTSEEEAILFNNTLKIIASYDSRPLTTILEQEFIV